VTPEQETIFKLWRDGDEERAAALAVTAFGYSLRPIADVACEIESMYADPRDGQADAMEFLDMVFAMRRRLGAPAAKPTPSIVPVVLFLIAAAIAAVVFAVRVWR
jgi:hypothetical protein